MKTLFALVAASAAALLLFTQCQVEPANANPKSTVAALQQNRVARGAYLMSVSGCDDCHTPKIMTPHGPEPDMSRRFSGHPAAEPFDLSGGKKELIETQQVLVFSAGLTAFSGPWGVSYAANLTPDDTGTGGWTQARFIKAIREGKSKGLDGTRPLLPPMPWPVYRNMTDEDLKSIYAFLRTVKPVQNAVPNPKSF